MKHFLMKIPPVPTVLFLFRDTSLEPSDLRLYLEFGLLMVLVQTPLWMILWYFVFKM